MASRSANVRGPTTMYCAATSAAFEPGSGWALPGLLISNSPAARLAPRTIALRGCQRPLRGAERRERTAAAPRATARAASSRALRSVERVDMHDLLGVGRSRVH